MASVQIDVTAPYIAANGHRMIAPIYQNIERGGTPYKISAYAWCADDCRACAAGGDPNDYAGEEW